MAPVVAKAKTAFLFYQTEMIGEIKNSLGPGASMGAAMTELSQRWRAMTQDQRMPFIQLELQDRERFQRESAEADAIATREQEVRRNALVVQEGEDATARGARARIERERAEVEEDRKKRREARDAETDPEILEERRLLREQKQSEALERQRVREEEERLLKDRKKKLNKEESKNAAKRLEYLLQQSSIFGRLMTGAKDDSTLDQDDKKSNGKDGGKYVPHHRHDTASAGKKVITSKKSDIADDEGDEEEVGSQEDHVFLTKQPTCIKFGSLKPYQLEGLNWMIHLAEKGLNGILADEMGLGKTVQSIAILAYHYEFQNIQGPHLVVVPKSTLSNWMNELDRWCPSLRVIKFHGSKDERNHIATTFFTNEAACHDGKRPVQKIRNKETGMLEDDNTENPRAWDVCVTTYEVCNFEKQALSKFAWKYLVIDEAHRLKNESSLFSQIVRGFSTSYRLLLTGTPLQNNLHELWALLNFLLPDIFSSSQQFDEWFNLEIEDEDAKKTMISQLHKILRPFMLRRLKADVAKGLPPKTETLIMVGMSKMQKKLYKKLLLRDLETITSSNSKNKTTILNIVMQLRKCCAHPYLFEGMEDRTLDPLGEHLVENCGKLHVLDKLLKKLKERGSRILIFTQMTRLLDILEDFMHMRGYKYCRIDGNTEYADRESSIEAFNAPNSDRFCFILSTRAGGLGINLQTADICVLYDSDWNPQADLQAQDRCHRLGQTKPVNVYRLVTENTIEEKIVERAQQKLKLDAMVVQQGRLKDKDKVTKEEIMAAVRFGADSVFRSEESTITDEDIDIILERGAAKTKELAEKLKAAEKGDLLDFKMDGGISAQTFEGIDYSDIELRNQLRLLAADSMGKRDRRPPPSNFNPIMQPAKSMIVNNTKIRLPMSLRLPSMEDHQFYNRERLLELSKLEFETYAALKEAGQLPRESLDNRKTILPDELGTEKLELLEEGFGNWTRSQYFLFVKAAAKYGRDDIQSIAIEIDLPIENVRAYSKAFWLYGPTELKKDEWERNVANIERGEARIAKRRKLSDLLKQFIGTFNNPRKDMSFANKGTVPFAIEQDRALLCSVDKYGHGCWDEVREELRKDGNLIFQHAVHGMNADAISKRTDYRMRQLEKELEAREKKLRSDKPANVVAAENAIKAIKLMEEYESESFDLQLRGQQPSSLTSLPDDARVIMEERLKERQQAIDKLREVEIQLMGCQELANNTKESIMRGDQYVNYSHISLKSGGQLVAVDGKVPLVNGLDIEAYVHAGVLSVPECGECISCRDSISRKLCVNRLRTRTKLIAEFERKVKESKPAGKLQQNVESNLDFNDKVQSSKTNKRKRETSVSHNSLGTAKVQTAVDANSPPIVSHGNKRMAIPEDLLPHLCRKIGANGTRKRMLTIENFCNEYPSVSVRQATFKFAEITTLTRPACIPEPPKPKGKGRAFLFLLRPRLYHLLPENERPNDWEKYAAEDEILWNEECRKAMEDKSKKDQETKDVMEDPASISFDGDSMEEISLSDQGADDNEKRKKTRID